jgi:hypothetical protein
VHFRGTDFPEEEDNEDEEELLTPPEDEHRLLPEACYRGIKEGSSRVDPHLLRCTFRLEI